MKKNQVALSLLVSFVSTQLLALEPPFRPRQKLVPPAAAAHAINPAVPEEGRPVAEPKPVDPIRENLKKKLFGEFPEESQERLLALVEEIEKLAKMDDIDFHKAAFGLTKKEFNTAFAESLADAWAKDIPETRAERLATLKFALEIYKSEFTPDYAWKLASADADAAIKTEVNVSEKLETYRIIRDYARSTDGLGMGNAYAEHLAKQILKKDKPLEAFKVFKKYYEYAILPQNDDGLGYSKDSALRKAEEKAGVEIPEF